MAQLNKFSNWFFILRIIIANLIDAMFNIAEMCDLIYIGYVVSDIGVVDLSNFFDGLLIGRIWLAIVVTFFMSNIILGL